MPLLDEGQYIPRDLVQVEPVPRYRTKLGAGERQWIYP